MFFNVSYFIFLVKLFLVGFISMGNCRVLQAITSGGRVTAFQGTVPRLAYIRPWLSPWLKKAPLIRRITWKPNKLTDISLEPCLCQPSMGELKTSLLLHDFRFCVVLLNFASSNSLYLNVDVVTAGGEMTAGTGGKRSSCTFPQSLWVADHESWRPLKPSHGVRSWTLGAIMAAENPLCSLHPPPLRPETGGGALAFKKANL